MPKTQGIVVEKDRSEVRAEVRRILLEQSLAENGDVISSLSKEQADLVLESLQKQEDEENEALQTRKPKRCFFRFWTMIGLPLCAPLIYFGYTRLDSCPLVKLPMWIMWTGILLAIIGLATVIKYLTAEMDTLNDKLPLTFIMNSARQSLIFWGLTGIYLIWGNWFSYNDTNSSDPRYCDFWVMIVSKILVSLFTLLWSFFAFLICYGYCKSRQ